MPLTEEDALDRARERWFTPPEDHEASPVEEESDESRCPTCGGSGYQGGGYPLPHLRAAWPACPSCDGTGEAQ